MMSLKVQHHSSRILRIAMQAFKGVGMKFVLKFAGLSQAEVGASGVCGLSDSQHTGARQPGVPLLRSDAEECVEPEPDPGGQCQRICYPTQLDCQFQVGFSALQKPVQSCVGLTGGSVACQRNWVSTCQCS